MNNLGLVAAEIESVITALSYRAREEIIAEAAAEIGATAEAAPSARAIAAAPGGGDFRTAQVRPWRRFLDRFISHRGRGDHVAIAVVGGSTASSSPPRASGRRRILDGVRPRKVPPGSSPTVHIQG